MLQQRHTVHTEVAHEPEWPWSTPSNTMWDRKPPDNMQKCMIEHIVNTSSCAAHTPMRPSCAGDNDEDIHVSFQDASDSLVQSVHLRGHVAARHGPGYD